MTARTRKQTDVDSEPGAEMPVETDLTIGDLYAMMVGLCAAVASLETTVAELRDATRIVSEQQAWVTNETARGLQNFQDAMSKGGIGGLLKMAGGMFGGRSNKLATLPQIEEGTAQ